ncbi:MAG: hypothetical protein JF603_13065 [Acidobacteria bacterium]|nr:hypothetical protein [Acidobacteriota bacterium]
MKVTRLFEDAAGDSHFDEVEIEMAERGGGISLSEMLPATGVVLMGAGGSLSMEAHQAPNRQLMIVLTGEWTATSSDGESRRFGPGEILLAEDTTGRGHATATPTEQGVVVAAVVVP